MSDNGTDLRAKVEERLRQEAEALGDQPLNEPAKLKPSKIKQCLMANELGDGSLFAHLHQGRFLHVKTTDKWLVWRNHHWEYDTMEERYHAVESVSDVYLEEAYRLQEMIDAAIEAERTIDKKVVSLRDEYYKRVKRLRSNSGASACLLYSHRVTDPLAIRGDELDTNPMVMAVNNGVIDLRTGKLRDGQPTDHLLKYCPTDWKGINCPAPRWEKFLRESLDGDPNKDPAEREHDQQAKIDFIRRALGYGITGLSTEHIFLVFNGAGRNGKGVLVETLRHVLGTVAGPIPAEMLLDQGRSATPSGPTPHIMALKGLRIAFASETDEGRRFSPGQVKWYSGGDTLKGRDLNAKDYIDFDPTHLLILLTNNLPHAPGDDFAFWQRLKRLEFHYSFITDPDPNRPNQKPRDENLREALKAEASGILAWLVRGCLEWQQIGLATPDVVKESTEDYRLSEDLITQFVTDTCDCDPLYQVNATTLYDLFKLWFRSNISAKTGACPAQKRFGSMLKKQFKSDKVGGTTRYFGLNLKENAHQLFPDNQAG